MKKHLLLILLFVSCLQVFPQETYLIRHKPQNTKGYLVLENNFQAGIRYWSVEIIQNVYDDFQLLDQRKMNNYTVIGKSYFRVPQEYLNMDNMSLRVTAHFQNNNYIVEETPISMHIVGGPNYEVYKTFPCIGSTYAYEIFQFKHNTVDKSYLSVYPKAEQIDPVVYYYEYFPLSVLNSINPQSYVNNINTPANLIKFWEYYDIPYINSNNLYINYPYIITKQNTNPQNLYHTGNGTPISEPIVFGVTKSLGPWSYSQLSGNCLKTVPFNIIDIPDIQTAIMFLNQFGSPVPCGIYPLSCDNITSPTGGIAPALNQEVGKEIELNLDTIVWIWDILYNFQNTARLEIDELWSPYNVISIQQISEAGNQICNLSIDDLFDSLGEPLDIPIQLNEGLYCISIHFDDGSFLRIIEEKTVKDFNPNAQANYLNAVIFPVPIVENSFRINFQAQKELDFVYVLYDFNGNPIYKTNIFINEGYSEDMNVEPYEGIPAGYLVNVFYFTDGSQLSILTVKSEQ